jgi:uncharacterized damage-inducible protein DinB
MASSLRARPQSSEYAPFYNSYIAAVPEGDVVALLRQSGRELLDAVAAIPEDRGGFRYAEGKWSIREVLGHLIDAERIFSYRVMRIARGDRTPLPSFDENEYVKTAGSDARTLASLMREFGAVRESSVQLFESLPDDTWGRFGVAGGKDISVRALAYITVGHAMHHLRILRERYGVSA